MKLAQQYTIITLVYEVQKVCFNVNVLRDATFNEQLYIYVYKICVVWFSSCCCLCVFVCVCVCVCLCGYCFCLCITVFVNENVNVLRSVYTTYGDSVQMAYWFMKYIGHV